MHYFRVMSVSFVMACITFPALAQSDVIQPGEERFSFGLGAVLNSFGTKLRLDNSNQGQTGSNVDLKDDLGVDQDASSFWASAEWRFAPRHRIGINYSQFKLTGTRTLTRNIVIDDETYPAGATLSSELKLQIIPIAYAYSFIKTEKDELAATIGVHWSRISFKAQGSASLNNSDFNADVTADADLPLPLIGLRYDHNFSQRWSAGLQGGYFPLTFGSLDGDIWTARAHVEYRFSKHVGLGFAVEGFQLDVESSQGSWQGEVKYSYWGPQIYLKSRF
jgi:predicted porin